MADKYYRLVFEMSDGTTRETAFTVPAGASAYEVAVENGFEGDEKAWLESLKGADGTGTGSGTAGADGEDGVGIAAVEQTTVSEEDGGENVITVTLTDGTVSTFAVKNGSKGSGNTTVGKGTHSEVTYTVTPEVGNFYFDTDAGVLYICSSSTDLGNTGTSTLYKNEWVAINLA